MKHKFLVFLFGVLFCLVLLCPVFAAETNTVTVTVYELEPGYYMCAVWDGDTLLTLFDAEVGSDGILNETVDIGDTPLSGDTVQVAVSSANVDSQEEIPPFNVSVEHSGSASGDVRPPSGGAGSGSTTTTKPSGGGTGGTGSGNTTPSTPEVPDVPDTPDTPWVSPFTDMSESDWFYDDVAYVVQNGLMTGVGNGQFNPGGTTTRGMIMTILARLAGVDTSGGNPWYQPGMEWAMRAGVSDGTGPETDITREQFVTMLWRYAGEPAADGNLTSYPDSGNVSGWASNAMIWAVQNGIINGSDGKLNPQGNALRSEAAAMFTRYCNNIEK